ncbi:hypothetical protein GF336_01960 [Candidatus Woesearchaeota archaeon]|nr:hypothetical protein [Candidatus Woesearchaeota archaeon]
MKIVLIIDKKDTLYLDNIKKRLDFYISSYELELIYSENYRNSEDLSIPYLFFGYKSIQILKSRDNKKNLFNIDFRTNHMDGWELTRLAGFTGKNNVNEEEMIKKFNLAIEKIKGEKLNRSYLFGTGPSLEKAEKIDWSDGYRVVCNTIVRDAKLWKHLNPHFIIAGDAIYHFGFSELPKIFRRDLKDRLKETQTYLVYPDYPGFHEIFIREFKEFKDRMIAIKLGKHKNVENNLFENFSLPALGNALQLSMLPLGCNLSKNVYLWGFDGRAPKDDLPFWNYSNKHAYPELIPQLMKDHPMFFEKNAPKSDTKKYTRETLGDTLENALSNAEAKAWKFEMMHKSWTPALQKRCRKNI